VHDILQQGTFNFPKLHLLTHYDSQIKDFGMLLQYSTEITEALHKPLKEAYRRSSQVDGMQQILDMIWRDYRIRMRKLNLIAWSRDIKVPEEILKIAEEAVGDREHEDKREKIRRPTLVGRQREDRPAGTDLSILAAELDIPVLLQRFSAYLTLNVADVRAAPDLESISWHMGHYYNILSVPVTQFQEDDDIMHKVQWTGKEGFRHKKKPRADWV